MKVNALIRMTALSLVFASGALGADFYWSGQASPVANPNNPNVGNPNAWVGPVPNLFNAPAQSDVWNFNVTGANPQINVPNVRAAGYRFGENAGAFTFTGSPLTTYGFVENGVRYFTINESGQTQVFANEFVSLHNNLRFDLRDGGLTFNTTVNLGGSNQEISVTGTGDLRFNNSFNVNSVRLTIANSGTNVFQSALNSVAQLDIYGGGHTTFNGNVSANNIATLVEGCFTTAVFNGGLASQKLIVDKGGTAVLGGSGSFNQGVEIRAGTLLLQTNNPIGFNPMTLAGGVLKLNGHSQNLQSLTLTANSVIDFGGATGSNQLNFNGANNWAAGAMLTVQGWQSSLDQLSILNATNQQVSQIRFYGDYGAQGLGFYSAQKQGNNILPGQFLYFTSPDALNLLPDCVTPVPEPTTVAAGAGAALLVLAHGWQRRRKRVETASTRDPL